MYGLSECLRAEKAFNAIENGNYELLGKMMSISHDGDRVVKDGKPFVADISDSYIRNLICNLEKETNVESSRLENQSGCYACSTPEIDFIVDTANAGPGVLGSEISGAGLGGCVVILVKKDKAEELVDRLDRDYYIPHGFECGAQVFNPSRGSSVIK